MRKFCPGLHDSEPNGKCKLGNPERDGKYVNLQTNNLQNLLEIPLFFPSAGITRIRFSGSTAVQPSSQPVSTSTPMPSQIEMIKANLALYLRV